MEPTSWLKAKDVMFAALARPAEERLGLIAQQRLHERAEIRPPLVGGDARAGADQGETGDDYTHTNG